MDPAFPTETFPAPITTEPNPPTETPQPTATKTPAPTATATPYQPFKAEVMVDGLLLRSGPGFLHEAYWTYPEGEIVEVLGRAPGWSWVYVHTSNKLLGWMKLELLDPEMSFYYAPEIIPEGFVIVKGHMYTPNGNPASHITLSLMPKDGQPADSDAATTDALGQFYFFLPKGSRGIWTLTANAYGCESNAVTSACNLIGQFPSSLEIDVQSASEVWYNLQMTYP
jgi:hypothetical protein